MSLTSQLKSGRLGRWCSGALVGTGALVDQVQAAAAGHDPVRPLGYVGAAHWATIGGAFGQRFAFLIAHEAPYAAYLGVANAGLLNPRLIKSLINRWPTRHRTITADPDTPGAADGVVEHLTWFLVEHLTRCAPPGYLADTPQDEETLARACWVLNGWETAYRAGQLPPVFARIHRGLANTPGADPMVDISFRGSAVDGQMVGSDSRVDLRECT